VVAVAFKNTIESAAGGAAVADAVLWRIAEAAAEVGITDTSLLARAASDAGLLG